MASNFCLWHDAFRKERDNNVVTVLVGLEEVSLHDLWQKFAARVLANVEEDEEGQTQ